MATTLLGPLLPLLASRWALSDASAGALFTAQFVGQLTATTLSTVVTGRLGERRTLAIGFAMVAIGVFAVGVVPAWLRWPAVLTYGLGLGCVLPVTNILVAALAPTRAGQCAESGQRVVGRRGDDLAADRRCAGRRPSSWRDVAAGGGVDGRRSDVGGDAGRARGAKTHGARLRQLERLWFQ